MNPGAWFSIADGSAILEDADLAIIRQNADVQASGENGTTGKYSLKSPESGSYCGDYGTLSINDKTGEIKFKLLKDKNGICRIKVVFSDTNQDDLSAEFAQVISPVNDSPVLSHHCALESNKEILYTCQIEAINPDNETLQYELASTNACAWAKINSITVGCCKTCV